MRDFLRLSSSLIALTAAPALAQSTAAETDSSAAAPPADIVVTARRTEERLQDIPVSVAAITAEQIAATGARGLEDIARQTPGFAFERTTGTLSQPVIRGQAQSRLTNPVQNVATFFNGIYLQRPYQVDSDLLELDRVEVIKGPQAALFGRNAFAGAISFVTRRPDLDEFHARVDGTIGNYDRRELRGSVSVPIGGIAGISFAGSLMKFGGTWPNNSLSARNLRGGSVRTRGNVGGYDNEGFLIQARLKPADWIEVNGFWSRRDIFQESVANYQISSVGLISGFNTLNCTPYEAPARARLGTNALFCGPLPARPVLAPGERRAPGIVADVRTFAQDSRTNVAGASADLTLSDALQLTYLFGYTDADALSLGTLSRDPERGVALPGPFFGRVLFDSRGNGEIESTSHELRANYDGDGVRVLAGAFASRVRDFDYGASYAGTPNSNAELTNVLFPAGNLFPPGFAATLRRERIRALFGLVEVEPLTGLRVTVEGRNTWERIRQQARTFPARTPVGRQFEREFRYFTPRFTLDYRPSEALLVYASAARGVKSGGFNPNAALAGEQVFAPEKNWTYELGAKSTLLGGRLALNASVFHVDWSSLQVNFAQTGGTIGTPLIIGNVSGARVNGAEFQAQFNATREITINAGLAYNRARFNDDAIDPVIPRALCQNPASLPPRSPPCPYDGDIGGRRIPRAPSFQANLGVSSRTEVGTFFNRPVAVIGRIDAAYQNRQFTDNTNTAWIPSRTIVDASVGLESDRWTLRAFARNLLDERYVSYAFAVFAGSGAGSGVSYAPLLGDRASYGLTLSLRY